MERGVCPQSYAGILSAAWRVAFIRGKWDAFGGSGVPSLDSVPFGCILFWM